MVFPVNSDWKRRSDLFGDDNVSSNFKPDMKIATSVKVRYHYALKLDGDQWHEYMINGFFKELNKAVLNKYCILRTSA